MAWVWEPPTHIDFVVFPQGNVQVSEGDGHGVECGPGRVSSVFVPGRDREPVGRTSAGLRHGVIAAALEMEESPVEGDVVGVPVDVAGGLRRGVASQDPALRLADLALLTRGGLTD